MRKQTKSSDIKRPTGFTIPESVLEGLRAIARSKDRSLSYMATVAFREFIERQNRNARRHSAA